MAGIFGVDIVVEPTNDDKLGGPYFKAELRSHTMKWDFTFALGKVIALSQSLKKQYKGLPLLRETNEPMLSSRRRYDDAEESSSKGLLEHEAELKNDWKNERADDIEEWLSKLICSYSKGQSIMCQKEVQTFLQIPDELYPEIEKLFPPRSEPLLKLVLVDRVHLRTKGRNKERATVERTLKLYSDGSLRTFTFGGKPQLTGALRVMNPHHNVSHGSHKHSFEVKYGRREWTISPNKVTVEKWIAEISKTEFDISKSTCSSKDPKDEIERLQKEVEELHKNIDMCKDDVRRIKEAFEWKKENLLREKEDIRQKYNNPRDGIPFLQYEINQMQKETEELHNQIETVINEEGNAFALLALTSKAKEKTPEPWQNWLRIGSVDQDKRYLQKPTEGEFKEMSLEMQKKFVKLSSKQKENRVFCHYHYSKNLHKHLHHHVADNSRTFHHSYSHTWILTEEPPSSWGYKGCKQEPSPSKELKEENVKS